MPGIALNEWFFVDPALVQLRPSLRRTLVLKRNMQRDCVSKAPSG
ncbi:MAG: hypothetical protein JWQ40_4861 [Segetibacter sp.]|nr:hypothetical protein [Segetibacter sp.]